MGSFALNEVPRLDANLVRIFNGPVDGPAVLDPNKVEAAPSGADAEATDPTDPNFSTAASAARTRKRTMLNPCCGEAGIVQHSLMCQPLEYPVYHLSRPLIALQTRSNFGGRANAIAHEMQRPCIGTRIAVLAFLVKYSRSTASAPFSATTTRWPALSSRRTASDMAHNILAAARHLPARDVR